MVLDPSISLSFIKLQCKHQSAGLFLNPKGRWLFLMHWSNCMQWSKVNIKLQREPEVSTKFLLSSALSLKRIFLILDLMAHPERSHLIACSVVSQVWLFCNPTDCIPPDFSVHGVLRARILEWVASSSSRGSSPPRDWTCAYILHRQVNSLPLVPPGKL